jgi:hypothetical protein
MGASWIMISDAGMSGKSKVINSKSGFELLHNFCERSALIHGFKKEWA